MRGVQTARQRVVGVVEEKAIPVERDPGVRYHGHVYEIGRDIGHGLGR
jgi:hypothetical protein